MQCVIAAFILWFLSHVFQRDKGGFFVCKFKIGIYIFICICKYIHIFRTRYIYNEKGRVEETYLAPSVESEEICDSLFSLENSKFHTSITKVCVLEVLRTMFSFTIEILQYKRSRTFENNAQCSCSWCQGLEFIRVAASICCSVLCYSAFPNLGGFMSRSRDPEKLILVMGWIVVAAVRTEKCSLSLDLDKLHLD